MEQTKLISIAEPDLRRYILPIVQEAYKIAGQNPPDVDSLRFTVEKFCFVLKTKFQNAQLDNISKFINSGAWGDYGDFKNISVKTLVHWVQSGQSRITTTSSTPDNFNMQKKAEMLFTRMRQEVPELYNELMLSLDKSIMLNANTKSQRYR